MWQGKGVAVGCKYSSLSQLLVKRDILQEIHLHLSDSGPACAGLSLVAGSWLF